MKTIKVLHLLTTDRFSGAESVVCDIITNSSDSIEHVYCSINGPIKDVLIKKNISFIPIKKINIKNVRDVINTYNPDIIHSHDYRASFIAAICKKNAKLISHIHNNSLWLRVFGIRSLIFLFSSLRANKVLIVSESIKKEYIFRKIIEKRTICIDNPVITEKILNKVDLKNKTIKYDICCIARITEAKDPFKFLSIIKDLVKINPKLKSIWVGDGELKNEVVEKCKKLNLNNNIQFIGFHDNPYTYLNQSKVFLLTSKWEGYGLVAFEAITLGKPCIVSNVGGLKNIIDEKCGKLCNPSSLLDFENEISRLLSDSNYYERKSKMAIKKSLKMDNKDKFFKKIESIYLSVLK